MKLFSRLKESVSRSDLLAAQEALRKGNKQQARSLLSKVIKKEYRLDIALLLYAEAVESRSEAISCLEQACKFDPNNEKALKLLERHRELERSEQEMKQKTESLQPSLSRNTFIGQEHIKKNLLERIRSAKEVETSLDHLLFCGSEEMGKCTLAHVVANELGVKIAPIRGSENSNTGDIAAILTNLESRDILLIEDIDQLSHRIIPILLSAISGFNLDITIGKGPSKRDITLRLPRFTLIGTTSKPSKVDKKICRWLIAYDFHTYTLDDLSGIIQLLALRQGYSIDPEASKLLAQYCDGSTGHAAALVKRIGRNCESYNSAKEALVSIGYSEKPKSSIEIGKYLDKLSGEAFEEYIAKLFSKMGYQVELMGKTGDHGIDIRLRRGNEDIAVQCKRWSDPVGEPIVRDFYGSLMHAEIPLGCIVATTTFTPQAIDFADGKPIKLIDFDSLIRLVIKNDGNES